MYRSILAFLVALIVPSVSLAEGRKISYFGTISGLGASGESEVGLNFILGVGLPPPTKTQNSPISRSIALSERSSDGVVSISRSIVRGEFEEEYKDVLIFGEVRNKAGMIDRYLPLQKVDIDGNSLEFNLDAQKQLGSFFRSSFPISGFKQASSPAQNMAVFRALDILLDQMVSSGGLTSCQLEDVYAVVREKVDFFNEGDALVVYYILEGMRDLNRDDRLAVASSECAEKTIYPYARFYAEVLNTIIVKISDRQIRGDRLHDRAFSDLALLYTGPSFLDAIPEASHTMDRALDMKRKDLCIELSSVLLQALIAAEPAGLRKHPSNVRSILNSVTRCAGLARELSNGGPNGAANNVKSLLSESGGQVVGERFLHAIQHLNNTGVLSGFSPRMRDIRDHFDEFEISIGEVQ